MFNCFDVPEFGNVVYIEGFPIRLRSDCQMGQFKLGADDLLGKTLKMQIVYFEIFTADLFGYDLQPWLSIYGVWEGKVTHIFFKTESIANFISYYQQMTSEKKAVARYVTEFAMNQKTSKRGETAGKPYYAVTFKCGAKVKDELFEEVKALCNKTRVYCSYIEDEVEHALPEGVQAQLTEAK